MSEKTRQNQLMFDFSGKKTEIKSEKISRNLIKRAVLGWLADQTPLGIGVKVPTRFKKGLADIAAFWSIPGKKRLIPKKTLIVEIRDHRGQCWPDCANKDNLLPDLRDAKEKKSALEKRIQRAEPHLREDDNLFEEFESWDYLSSSNMEYHKCLRSIENLESALYQGSRFERIRAAHVANALYLAVPENTIHPDELADGWGLLQVNRDFTVKEIRAAEKWDCPEENQLHLIQQIAAANKTNLFFANGIRETKEHRALFTRTPHQHRKGKFAGE